jgi:RNA polymerase sigma-70 factor (ECF subfamily)
MLEWVRPYLLRIANDELDSNIRPKVGPSDLVQQTFIEAQQGFAGFRGASQEKLTAWLRGILRHNLADARTAYQETAKRQLKQEQLLDAAHAGPLRERLTTATPSPLDRVIADEEVQALQEALQRLSDDYRLVLRLHHQEGQSFVEIGATMGRSADAVRKLWFRAVEALRQELRGLHGSA